MPQRLAITAITSGKKFFTSFTVFLAVFIGTSLAADVYYYHRLTYRDVPRKGWICRNDFRVFWTAGYMLKNYAFPGPADTGHSDDPAEEKELNDFFGRYRDRVYNTEEPFYHFRYAPLAACLMMPFALIRHPSHALALWLVLTNIAMLGAILLVARYARRDFAASEGVRYAILWAALIASVRFYLMDISVGQSDVFIALGFALFLGAYARGRGAVAGLILAFIFQCKPAFIPMLVYFTLARRWSLVATALAASAAFLMAPAALIGFEKTAALLQGWIAMLGMSIPSQLMLVKNQSITYFIARAVAGAGAAGVAVPTEMLFAAIGGGLTLASYMALLAWRRMVSGREEARFRYLEVSLLIIVSLVFSPLVWVAQFVSLFIPAATAVVYMSMGKRRAPLYTALAGFVALSVVAGTDLTNFLPAIDQAHWPNIAAGALCLAYAVVCGYRQTCE